MKYTVKSNGVVVGYAESKEEAFRMVKPYYLGGDKDVNAYNENGMFAWWVRWSLRHG